MNTRAAVVGAVIFVPALAVAGLNQIGAIPFLSKPASAETETPSTAVQTRSRAAFTSADAHGATSLSGLMASRSGADPVAAVALRRSMAKVFGASETAQPASEVENASFGLALTFSENTNEKPADPLLQSLGVSGVENRVSFEGVGGGGEGGDLASDVEGLAIEPEEPIFASVLAEVPEITDILRGSAAVMAAQSAQGVTAGEQAPVVNRFVSNPAPSIANEGGGEAPNRLGRDSSSPTDGFDGSDGDTNVVDVPIPTPGVASLAGVAALVVLRRRRG
ncbi:MAG: hypothetical protein SFZ24_00015 [Planctomycetota bacterium]|nr:hypothetical protein [Planctomycetota bacterium]